MSGRPIDRINLRSKINNATNSLVANEPTVVPTAADKAFMFVVKVPVAMTTPAETVLSPVTRALASA